MENESDRAIADIKLEEAKRAAIAYFDKDFDLKFETPDPNWAQPAPTNQLPSVGIDQAQGFWINGGKQGGKKDDPITKPETFDHDLPSLAKDGPKDLPPVQKDEPAKLTPEDIEKRIKARQEVSDDDLATLLNVTVEQFRKGVSIGLYSPEVIKKTFKELT